MIIPIILLAVMQGGQAPDIPPGINGPTIEAFYRVEGDLQKGNFEAAREDEKELPKRDISIRWDDSDVPTEVKNRFKAALVLAIDECKGLPGVHVGEGAPADISFKFVSRLPKPEDSLLPAGATDEFQTAGPERLAVRIALERMDNPSALSATDVHNEVAYALGQYFGLERMPRFGTFSSRTDQPALQSVSFTRYETALATEVLSIADQLRELTKSETKISFGVPKMGLSTNEITGVTGSQNNPLEVSLDVYNKGNADLKLFVEPDCSCLAPRATPVIKPGETGQIVADVNTGAYVGHLNHSLLVYSNDPEWPLGEIKIQMYVAPLYRFYKESQSTILYGENGADSVVYLIMSPQADIQALTASVVGPKGFVEFQPWSGVLPNDPDSKGQEVRGYKFHMHFPRSKFAGVAPASLVVGTDAPRYRELIYSFNLQKGIVAEPAEVYLGHLTTRETRIKFLVKEPGKSFRILKVASGSPYISAAFDKVSESDEHQVEIRYNGKASGDFSATLNVYTSDLKQPVISVPVAGSVR